jgi:DNA invertase Pin-like site-specific DNA recombinase
MSGMAAYWRVEFVVAALGRQTDPFVLHLYAALAEKERAMISERTKAGLAAAKRRGQRLGMGAKTKAAVRRIARLDPMRVLWPPASGWKCYGLRSSTRSRAELLCGRHRRSSIPAVSNRRVVVAGMHHHC